MKYTLIECQEIIESEIKQLDAHGKAPVELYEPITYTLSNGGKRIRPALTLLACNLFSNNIEHATGPAIGIEVFHNFTLLHDDVLDNAKIRRGKASVHEKWNNNIAILSGDAMMIMAYQLLSRTSASVLPAIMNVFNQAALEICEGQQYDMNFETLENVSIPQYIHMIRLKTSVLLAAALKIGALAGGANNTEARQLYDFGINLGLAFQLQDDLLDAYATSDKFGKTTGGDIASNKKTFLMLKALELANAQQKSELHRWFRSDAQQRHEKIKAVLNIYNQLNIQSITQHEINVYYANALQALQNIGVPNENKKELLNIYHSLKNRNY